MTTIAAGNLEPDMIFCLDDLVMRQVIRARKDIDEPGRLYVNFLYLYSQTTEWIKFDEDYQIPVYGILTPLPAEASAKAGH